MARRIKESPSIHRKRIAFAAEKLFSEYGANNVSVEKIADTAGYSKATLYVYFESKEEIISYLTLESMIKLKEYLSKGLEDSISIKDKYYGLCEGLERYAIEYPYYFKKVLEPINIDFTDSKFEDNERLIFNIGEEINQMIGSYINIGISEGVFREDISKTNIVFAIWGLLSGVIELATNKLDYIEKELLISKKEFLNGGYELVYEGIKKK